MKALAGKVAIVTGASSGIGHAIARLFAREGAQIVVAARRSAELERLASDVRNEGGTVVAMTGDVTQEGFAQKLVATAVAQFGGLDVAVNNAGTLGEMGPTPDLTLSAWRHTIETNLTSGFLGAKFQIPALLERGGGSINKT